ncbi:hypothetical protein Tco_0151628 [Tanacetum coccineum]
MPDNRTMAKLLQAPTEGDEDAIVNFPKSMANFELKHGLINLEINKQFFGHDKEDPHAHIRYFNKITSTMRFPDVPSTSIKLMLFPFSLAVENQNPVSEPVVAPVSVPMPNPKPSIPYPSRRNDEKRRENANEKKEKFYEIFKDTSFEISFMDVLTLMPKFASTLKALIGNKEKLSEMARTPLNEHCLAVILNKLPEKLGDPRKILTFQTLTRRAWITRTSGPFRISPGRVGIANRMSTLKFGLFKFLCDSCRLDFESDLEYNKSSGGRRVNPKIHDVIKKEVEKLLDAGLIYPISDSPWVSPVHCVPKKGGMTVVTNDENELVPTRLVTGWRVCIDYRKLNEATRKDHFPLPFMDQMLERLAGNEYYCFLDGFSGYFQIPIDPKYHDNTTSPAHRRELFCLPPHAFRLCNAPARSEVYDVLSSMI